MTDTSILPQNGTERESGTFTGSTNGSDVTAEMQSDWVVLLPKWSEAVQRWGAAWDVHVLTFAVCFLGQALAVIFIGIKFHKKVFRIKVIMCALVLLSLFGILRFVFFVVDPYGYNDTMSSVMNHLLLQSVYPPLCGSYGLLQIVLVKVTGVQIGGRRSQRFQSVLFVALGYALCMGSVHLTVFLNHRFRPVLLLDSCFLVGWLSYLCVTFICGGFRISEYALEAKQARKEFISSRKKLRRGAYSEGSSQGAENPAFDCLLLQLCACCCPRSHKRLIHDELGPSPRASFIVGEAGDDVASTMSSDSDAISLTSSVGGSYRKAQRVSFWKRQNDRLSLVSQAKMSRSKQPGVSPRMSVTISETFCKTCSDSEFESDVLQDDAVRLNRMRFSRNKRGVGTNDIPKDETEGFCVKYKHTPKGRRRNLRPNETEKRDSCENDNTCDEVRENWARSRSLDEKNKCASSTSIESQMVASSADVSFVREEKRKQSQETTKHTPKRTARETLDYESRSWGHEYYAALHLAAPDDSRLYRLGNNGRGEGQNYTSSASEHEAEVTAVSSSHEDLQSTGLLSTGNDLIGSTFSATDNPTRLTDGSDKQETSRNETSRMTGRRRRYRGKYDRSSSDLGVVPFTTSHNPGKSVTEFKEARHRRRCNHKKHTKRPLLKSHKCTARKHPYHQSLLSQRSLGCLRRIQNHKVLSSKLVSYCCCETFDENSSSENEMAASGTDSEGYLADNELPCVPLDSVISRKKSPKSSSKPTHPLRLEARALMSYTGQHRRQSGDQLPSHTGKDSVGGTAGRLPHSETTFTIIPDDEDDSVVENVQSADLDASLQCLDSRVSSSSYYLGELQDKDAANVLRLPKPGRPRTDTDHRRGISLADLDHKTQLIDVDKTRRQDHGSEISDKDDDIVSVRNPDLAASVQTIRLPLRTHAQRHTSVDLNQIRRAGMVGRAVQGVYLLTFLHLFTCLLQLYKAFGRYGVLWASGRDEGVAAPDPWPWLTFQTLVRWVWLTKLNVFI
ncbi:hypothetical protein BaRGS_00022614 [Batillaria attramentaria]|uniref:Proline-rich transmembrane protein 3/4 domain-containing protein n=1 Tax=Batillaria attramentaria TaxID=370345 RepID=A0ABD0KG46_9CAEN